MSVFSKTIVLLTAVALCLNVMVFFSQNGFTVDSMTKDSEKSFLQNAVIEPISEEPIRRPIIQFDVREDGFVLICTKNGEKKSICVYSSDGVFAYGFTCFSYGTVCAMWNDANIDILFVREKIIVTMNPTGTVLNVAQQQKTSNNNSHFANVVLSTEKKINQATYVLKGQGLSTYSQLVMIDMEDEHHIIYKVEYANIGKYIAIFTILAIIVIVGVILWRKRFTINKKA